MLVATALPKRPTGVAFRRPVSLSGSRRSMTMLAAGGEVATSSVPGAASSFIRSPFMLAAAARSRSTSIRLCMWNSSANSRCS